MAGGRILRIPPSPDFVAQEKQMDLKKLPHFYAKNSLWYDALESLAYWIQKEKRAEMPHRLRSDLLKQVDLSEVAVHDKVQ